MKLSTRDVSRLPSLSTRRTGHHSCQAMPQAQSEKLKDGERIGLLCTMAMASPPSFGLRYCFGLDQLGRGAASASDCSDCMAMAVAEAVMPSWRLRFFLQSTAT